MSTDDLREQLLQTLAQHDPDNCGGLAGPWYYEPQADALMPIIREAQARALTDAADRLPGATEGPQREGTARWPQVHREVYSLAIDEAQVALRDRATTYTERAD